MQWRWDTYFSYLGVGFNFKDGYEPETRNSLDLTLVKDGKMAQDNIEVNYYYYSLFVRLTSRV